jgi:hypothetical protein
MRVAILAVCPCVDAYTTRTLGAEAVAVMTAMQRAYRPHAIRSSRGEILWRTTYARHAHRAYVAVMTDERPDEKARGSILLLRGHRAIGRRPSR